MECVSPILEVAKCMWGCTAKRLVYIRELQEKLDSLKSLTEELSSLSKDVIERVEREEQLKQSKRTHEVDGWLRAVQLMEDEVGKILQKADQEIQKRCLGRSCPKNCRSSYKLGKIVTQKIDDVTKLKGKGHFDVVAARLPIAPVDERPMGKTVGLDLLFDKVRVCLDDDKVRSLGLYGIGGVGKTTLLKRINNEYFGTNRNGDFDLVIWVVVSKSISTEKIQLAILKKLGAGPTDEDWKGRSKEEKAAEIFRLLKAKNFVILLDDMWDRLDLLEVGIPIPIPIPPSELMNDQIQTKSKVVLTTRSERVCDGMEVDKRIKIECLTPDEAFSLFCDKVGENTLNSHPDIRRLAKIVAEECRGLPLALIVVGRSMASRRTPRDWDQAIQALRSYQAKFAGMEVFPNLKFSYDRLVNDNIKSCFLFCSLYPEDYKIPNDELISLWIGEGSLDVNFGDDLYEARNQGEEIIRSLKLACLMEGGVSERWCRMHDVIRDMAQWLSYHDNSREADMKYKSFALDHVDQLIGAHETVKWKDAQRISLWHSNINTTSVELRLSVLPPSFSLLINLHTLILRNSNMKAIPNGFFQHMPVIRVLDLEGNMELKELPLEICRLEGLEYLNLGWTSIEKIPAELKNLTKLRCLLLHSVAGLKVIPPNVICCLSKLQMCDMILDDGSAGSGEYEVGFIVSVLEELDCLQYLSEMSITLPILPAVQKFLTSQKLQKCIQDLRICSCDGLTAMELTLSTLQKMRFLELENCYDLEHVTIKMGDHDQNREQLGFSGGRGHIFSNSNLFLNLVYVNISECHGLLDLSWLIYAPSLEYLHVDRSDKMEEIIGSSWSSTITTTTTTADDDDDDDEGGEGEYSLTEIFEQQTSPGIFSRLEVLALADLPNLKSICRWTLLFPSLTMIRVSNCPNLRKLPLNSSSATNNTIQTIEGESRWWEELKWEDDNLKPKFTPYFQDITND